MKEFWTENGVAQRPFSILHVDSDLLMRTILKKTIPGNLFRLDSAANGREAFLLLEKNDYAYDVVITEMHMHYANGYEIYNRVLQFGPKTTVIVTSNMSFFHIREGLDLERENYFKKPLVIGKLIKRISELLIPCTDSDIELDAKLLQHRSELSIAQHHNDDSYVDNAGTVTVTGNQFEANELEEVTLPELWSDTKLAAENLNNTSNAALITSLSVPQHNVLVGPGNRWW